jgi:16S rRNA G966 N2-methylase RsmD
MSPASSQEQQDGALFYGDNLDVLRRYIDDQSVDLVYLDPPFNSNANYNVCLRSKTGRKPQVKSRLLRTLGAGTRRPPKPSRKL